ncbi:MAG: bifunctional pyr operon transcriptional regulator/uracil phosphoribosyltransferase PyrR [Pseudomonadota bacterium]
MTTPALPSAETLIDRIVERMASQVDARRCALVGIHSGGVWIAERLHARLGIAAPLGTIDVGLHRDDLDRSGLRQRMRASMIPFEVAGADIVLVDDVLYTGRTIRAAMNELFDYGRPDRIRLAALVDRGGRHLPIAADFLGCGIELEDRLEVVLERGGEASAPLSLRVSPRTSTPRP